MRRTPKITKLTHQKCWPKILGAFGVGISKGEKKKQHLCHGQKSRFFGDGKNPTFNDGILISWGPINPYGLGLMSSHPLLYGKFMGVDRPDRTSGGIPNSPGDLVGFFGETVRLDPAMSMSKLVPVLDENRTLGFGIMINSWNPKANHL